MRRFAFFCLIYFSGYGLAVLFAGRAGETWSSPRSEDSAIGRVAANRSITPTGQVLTPAGQQIGLPGMRPQALALSPDGALLAVAGKKDALFLLDPSTGQILQKAPLCFIETKLKPETKTAATNSVEAIQSEVKTNPLPTIISVTNTAEMSLTGLIFSHAGDRIYLSNTKGNV